MEDYHRRCSALKERPHRYSLQQFGLTEADVLRELGDYAQAYGVGQGRRAASR